MKFLSDRDLLARLVGFDTTSRNSNLPLADFICDYVDDPDVRIARQASPDGLKTNLVIARGPATRDGSGLTLSGHMDVVPATEEGWDSDPFTLSEQHDRLIARGACDMKGFIAIAMNRFVGRRDRRLTYPLVLLFTYDEELGTIGSRHFVQTWDGRLPLPVQAIIGEPTSLRPTRLHKGHLKLRITTSGVSAHSGLPHLGRNAIEPAGRIITALSDLRRELESEREQEAHFPDVPYIALNVAQVSGGSAINIVPDRCVIEVGVRTLPGTDVAQLTKRIQDRAGTPGDDFQFEVAGDSPPMESPGSAPFHQCLIRHAGRSTDVGANFATDAGWLQTIGMQCVLLGPGSMDVAHRPNEWLSASELARGSVLIEAIVGECCAGDPA